MHLRSRGVRTHRGHRFESVQRAANRVGAQPRNLLAYAAVYGLSPLHRGNVYLVTCGSPIASLYHRFFPRWFTPEGANDIRMSLGGWWNFSRKTDPIGQDVLEKPFEISLKDPSAQDLKIHFTRPRGHSDYWSDATINGFIEHLSTRGVDLTAPTLPRSAPATTSPRARLASSATRPRRRWRRIAGR